MHSFRPSLYHSLAVIAFRRVGTGQSVFQKGPKGNGLSIHYMTSRSTNTSALLSQRGPNNRRIPSTPERSRELFGVRSVRL